MNVEQDQESTQGTDNQTAEQSQQDILDLDSHSSFKYQGNAYTQDQFADIYDRANKYGEAQKYVDEDQRFATNVRVDIDKVLQNPSLTEAFKRTYPERYHWALDLALSRSQQGQSSQSQPNQQQQQQSQGLPKEVMERLSRIDALENRLHQADVQAASAQIDNVLNPLLSKYELADEDKVLMEAEKILARNQKLTPAVWERIVKEDHQRAQKRADKVYQAKLKSQLDVGERGRDMGAGGATPSQAPVKPKTFAEAQEAMINSLKRK